MDDLQYLIFSCFSHFTEPKMLNNILIIKGKRCIFWLFGFGFEKNFCAIFLWNLK